MGRKYGITVTNGTAAIDAAIEAIGIKKEMRLFYQHSR